jgi:hypothetical protein
MPIRSDGISNPQIGGQKKSHGDLKRRLLKSLQSSSSRFRIRFHSILIKVDQ